MALAPVLLAADSVSGQSSFLRDIPPGKYEALFLKLSGDAAAAQQLLEAGFGRIRLTEAGRDLVAIDYDNLLSINRLKGGNARVTNTAGAAHAFPCIIPRGYYDNNVHQIIEADVVQVSIQYGATFTTVFTGADRATQKVYGLVRETGEMTYNLLMHQIDQTYGTGTFTLPLRHENVLAIYLEVATEGNLDRVRVVRDGEEAANITTGSANAGEDEDLQELSDMLNNTTNGVDSNQAAESAVCEIQVAEPGEIGEFLSDDVTLEFTTSPAATYVQETVVLSADFTPTKLRQTKVETSAIVQRKVARKNTLGRGRPVQTLRIAAE